jgi:hypothetical protein
MTNGEVRSANPLEIFKEERIKGVKYLCVKEVEAIGTLEKLIAICKDRMKALEKEFKDRFAESPEYIMLIYRKKVLALFKSRMMMAVDAKKVGKQLEFGYLEVSSKLLDAVIRQVMSDIRSAKVIE